MYAEDTTVSFCVDLRSNDKSNLDLKINNTALPMATHTKVLGLTLDQKLIYSTRIHIISVQAHKQLQMIKALTATGWRHSRLPIRKS